MSLRSSRSPTQCAGVCEVRTPAPLLSGRRAKRASERRGALANFFPSEPGRPLGRARMTAWGLCGVSWGAYHGVRARACVSLCRGRACVRARVSLFASGGGVGGCARRGEGETDLRAFTIFLFFFCTPSCVAPCPPPPHPVARSRSRARSRKVRLHASAFSVRGARLALEEQALRLLSTSLSPLLPSSSLHQKPSPPLPAEAAGLHRLLVRRGRLRRLLPGAHPVHGLGLPGRAAGAVGVPG